jgi:hypothetical protein
MAGWDDLETSTKESSGMEEDYRPFFTSAVIVSLMDIEYGRVMLSC